MNKKNKLDKQNTITRKQLNILLIVCSIKLKSGGVLLTYCGCMEPNKKNTKHTANNNRNKTQPKRTQQQTNTQTQQKQQKHKTNMNNNLKQ